MGGSFQNRLRAGDFLELFEQTGFRIEWAGYMPGPPSVAGRDKTDLFEMCSKPVSELYPHRSIDALESCIDDDLFESFHADFRTRTRQELSVMGMCVVCQRPG